MQLTVKNKRLVFTLTKPETELFRKSADQLTMLALMGLSEAATASDAILKTLEAVSASQHEEQVG